MAGLEQINITAQMPSQTIALTANSANQIAITATALTTGPAGPAGAAGADGADAVFDDSDFVHIDGNENINDSKIFNDGVAVGEAATLSSATIGGIDAPFGTIAGNNVPLRVVSFHGMQQFVSKRGPAEWYISDTSGNNETKVMSAYHDYVSLNTHQIRDVTDPSAAQHVATKNYVDTNFVPKTRVTTLTASSNTYTPNGTTTDLALITSPAANFTVAAPTGTPTDGQSLLMRIKSGATGYTPTWNAIYQSSGIATLPSSVLPASKTVTLGFKYDSAATKWVLLAVDATGY